ncbi:MAG: prevent-host-death protein [Gammaproteobacteria bacterium]|nr:prevent-host-death protein [Gammaproteobacteria bacterium]
MRAVGIKTLNSRLSEYIRIAAQGETVLVTDRDRVVAELSPPSPRRSEVLGDAMLAEGVRKGWIRPPLISLAGGVPSPEGINALDSILSDLDADRSDR